MSTDQTDLSSYDNTQTPTLEETHAQTEPDQLRTWTATQETNVCLTCGHDIPENVCRVFGDNDGCVPCCKECTLRDDNREFVTHSALLIRETGGLK